MVQTDASSTDTPLRMNRRGWLAGAGICFLGCSNVGAQDLPLRIESSEAEGVLEGQIEAISPFAFDAVVAALRMPQSWCEILMLHLNNKTCRLDGEGRDLRIALTIARKHDQPAVQGHLLLLSWQLQALTTDRMVVRLLGADGPYGTTDYTVVLTAEALPAGGTRIAFRYACRFGTAARMLMQTYLATLARDKVGFTTLQTAAGPKLIGGLRGVVERTAMRYYLAVEAWLQAASLPAESRPLARLEAWFDATERYPLQLREIDKASYLRNKRLELRLPP